MLGGRMCSKGPYVVGKNVQRRTLQCATWWGGGGCLFIENNLKRVFGRRKTKSIPAAAVNAISKTTARGLLTRAGAKGRSKATSGLSRTPPDIRFKDTKAGFFYTRRRDRRGLLSSYHKDKEPASSGERKSDQSAALFPVRIAFSTS